ncbi:glycosyltransferase family protein [Mucilaginibacter polytrichastri]|uniref:Spore protein YkvP/CgeB glycosyl transferase-like domain-containing protein n=1 Tax=Mucilaginibacter polytrichastri TaxID=1302689 RepID=A0A1Q5ZYV9_9SPHI|nr:hypothetical protein [Mucilaginibacter polytrichastri]OKS86936.1 hypothetical protein RG47T_2394 [Mucilaginibacter polytrichastri]SFS84628.1 hypothetical protein SAMN04487890_1056 [Mucilaginibacter polytrichastri]
MDSEKRKILFICPAFFGYEISIKDALIFNGYEVDYFDERTSNKSYYKAIFRVRKSLLSKIIDKYYRQIFEKIKDKSYNYFFLIKGEVVPEWFITSFMQLNPTAKLIYYTYDSFNNNNKNSLYILKYFDSCYSFDFEDVKKNKELKLKHLFFTNDYQNKTNIAIERKYDMSFVGTLHSNRYCIIKKIASQLGNTFVFYFMPAKWFFYANKILKKDYRKIKADEVSFNKISKMQVAEIFRSSKSVLDIQRFGQTGLTMRTFEVLASGSILITTNAYIKEADFYDTEKIIVLEDIDRLDNGEIIKQKINNADNYLKPIDPNFNKYFINNWVKEFFE